MSTTALITGGTSGIGRAVANKLAQLGIHTLVVGRNEERGEKTIAEIRAAGGQADFISSDLRDASSAVKSREERSNLETATSIS
jgi:NAD(P)-dependent dehydrogenase (short-subunit alcohol dehydrogenase family)